MSDTFKRFKQVKFERDSTCNDRRQESRFEFFVPGVNSGAYDPTLRVVVVVEEWIAGFFGRLFRTRVSTQITLREAEFDELFLEMQKIKMFRDGLNDLRKKTQRNEPN
jgi:hypothetical protein